MSFMKFSDIFLKRKPPVFFYVNFVTPLSTDQGFFYRLLSPMTEGRTLELRTTTVTPLSPWLLRSWILGIKRNLSSQVLYLPSLWSVQSTMFVQSPYPPSWRDGTWKRRGVTGDTCSVVTDGPRLFIITVESWSTAVILSIVLSGLRVDSTLRLLY